MKHRFSFLFAALLLLPATQTLAQNSAADTLTALESHSLARADGSPAFHLKADFQASGNVEFKGAGTYEEWWLSPSRWRKEVTLGKYHLVLLCVDGKITRDSTEDYIPMRIYQLLTNVLPALPTQQEMADDGGWSSSMVKVKNVDLIRLAGHGDPPKDGKLVPPEYAYYVDPQRNVVQLHERGFDLYIYDKPGKLTDRSVMLDGKLLRNGKTALEFHITSLTAISTPDNALFQVSSAAKPGFEFGIPSHEFWKPPVRVLGQVDRRRLRQRGAPSEVIAGMQLDPTGAVREVDPIFSTDSIVTDYVTYDLHHFKYAATVVDGIPVTAYQTYTTKEGAHEMWRSIR